MATIKHVKTDTIADWTQADLDAQIAAGNYPPGTVLADIVLPSDWNDDHNITGTVDVANGGTGQSTYTDGQLLIGNSTGNTLSKSTLTAGTNVTITNGPGTITIAATAGSTSPGGSTTQVQYNNAGAFAGSANFTFNGTTVTTANDASISGLTVGKGGGAVATNTAVGFQAINATATGTANAAFGYQSLFSNTSGINNAGFGSSTLVFNTTGQQNTGIGSASLFANSTGSSNTGVGYFSLNNNISGSTNTALGQLALRFNTTGSNNTAVGASALTSNTTNVATLGSITGGSGYTNGTYTARAMTPVSGATFTTYPTVDVTVSGGAVTAVTLVTRGVGASVTTATVLTVAAALIGGTGSGFSIPVATFATGQNNTVMGATAGQNNTTGGITAFGYQAGQNNTTGGVTAFGSQALQGNTTGSDNVAFGSQALRNTTTGNFNTGVGYALQANTTGANNTGVGRQTLTQNTTSSNNTAIGFTALNLNTTNVATLGAISAGGTGYNGGASGGPLTVQASLSSGSGVSSGGSYPTLSITVTSGVITAATLVTNGASFVDTTTVLTVTSAAMVTAGFAAGGSGFTIPVATLQSGINNTAVGAGALKANTVGQYNIAMGGPDSAGFEPLRSNTTASFNLAIAPGALARNTTGFSNTAIGFQVLYNNTTGVGNVGIGGVHSGQVNAALNANVTGSQNTAVGSGALRDNTASDNTALGWAAGLSVSTGTQNTLIGRNAGQSGTNNLTTGSNNIIIGYNAAASSATVSNEVTIGNSSVTATRLQGNVTTTGTIKAQGYTVATLPTGVVGARAYVTDALAPTFLTALTGGGAVTTPAFYNGTAWVAG